MEKVVWQGVRTSLRPALSGSDWTMGLRRIIASRDVLGWWSFVASYPCMHWHYVVTVSASLGTAVQPVDYIAAS